MAYAVGFWITILALVGIAIYFTLTFLAFLFKLSVKIVYYIWQQFSHG